MTCNALRVHLACKLQKTRFLISVVCLLMVTPRTEYELAHANTEQRQFMLVVLTWSVSGCCCQMLNTERRSTDTAIE